MPSHKKLQRKKLGNILLASSGPSSSNLPPSSTQPFQPMLSCCLHNLLSLIFCSRFELSIILASTLPCPLNQVHSRFSTLPPYQSSLASTLPPSTSQLLSCCSHFYFKICFYTLPPSQPSLASTVPCSQLLSLPWCHPLNALSVVKRIEENHEEVVCMLPSNSISRLANQTVVAHAVNSKYRSNSWSPTIFYTINMDRLAPVSIVIQSHNQHFGKEGRADTLALLLVGT